ncbi:hypothetical protein Tco_0307074 [Tanacetum coccineum]
MHMDEEVHTDEEELHADDDAHDDEYMHDDDENHDDTDKEMNNDENLMNLKMIKKWLMQKVPPSSSSLSLSSNYGNQFLNLSSNTSLVGTTKEPTTSTSLPTPPISSEAPTNITTVPDPLLVVLQRLSNLERKFEAWTKVDHSKAIEESVLANIINEVKNQLPKFLPKAFFDFVNPRIESTIHESKDKVQTGSSSKGKTQSKPSSTDKPVNAEEPLLEAEMDVEEPILDDVVNEADQTQDQAAPTQGNPT